MGVASQEETTVTTMTFTITTHMPGYHPGLVKVQERRDKNSHEIGGYDGVRLYEGKPGPLGGAYRIAEAIYDDETRPRQSSTHRDARFDFTAPCTMHFYQKREAGGGTLAGRETEGVDRGRGRTSKRAIGTLSLPGGFGREAICTAIAEVIAQGWEAPSELAYIPPDLLTSARGTLLYGPNDERFNLTISLEHNGRLIEVPLIFLAWSTRITRFATLHLGRASGGDPAHFYHGFTLLNTEYGWLLCDDGVHAMDERLTIAGRDGADPKWYYAFQTGGPYLLVRGDDLAIPEKAWGGIWSTPAQERVREMPGLLERSLKGFSLYCEQCQQGWLWEASLAELTDASFLPTLCPHCWFCSQCGRFTTPTDRADFYSGSPCHHPRPQVPERRLQVQDHRAATLWRTHRILSPRSRLAHAASTGPGESERVVLIAFSAPWSGAAEGETETVMHVPAGTRLIGIGGEVPPENASGTYRVVINNTLWEFPSGSITVNSPDSRFSGPCAQAELAQESLRAASESEARGEALTALDAYARALVELAASGAEAPQMADARMRCAELLLQQGQPLLALSERERACDEYERVLEHPYTSPENGLALREKLVRALISLAAASLRQDLPPAPTLQRLATRLLLQDVYLGHRPQYRGCIVEMRATAALLYASIGELAEARYQLRLVENWSTAVEREPVANQLSALRGLLFPEEAVLAQLRATRNAAHADTGEPAEGAAPTAEVSGRQGQRIVIYIRTNRPGQPPGVIDLEEYTAPWMGTNRKLQGGTGLRVADLAQPGRSAGAALAEVIYRDLSERPREWIEGTADFQRAITIVFCLLIGVPQPLSQGRGRGTTRYGFEPMGPLALPGGLLRDEACTRMATALDRGLLLLGAASAAGTAFATGERKAAATALDRAQTAYSEQSESLGTRLTRLTTALYAVEGDRWIPLAAPPVGVRSGEPAILYDLAAVCAAVFQEKVKPNTNGGLPKKLIERLRPLLRGQPRIGAYDEDRYPEILFEIAGRLGLIRLPPPMFAEGEQRYQRAPHYLQWAGYGAADHIRQLIELWSKTPWWMDLQGAGFQFDESAWEPLKARALLLSSLKQCTPGQWYSTRSLLYTLWRQHPAALRINEERLRIPTSPVKAPTHEQWEDCEGAIFLGALASTLYELGVVSLGFQSGAEGLTAHGSDPDAFCLTELGGAVLSDPQSAATPAGPGKRVFVQPTLEIVLLEPDFPALFNLLPFARLIQVGTVSRLKLTKESVLRGRASGLNFEDMLSTLSRLSTSKEIPQNVAYSLEEWSEAYREAAIAQVILVEVSDERAGDALCRHGFLHARRLAPRLLAISPEAASIQEVWRVCEQEGISIRRSFRQERSTQNGSE